MPDTKAKLLIVDDAPAIRTLLCDVLTEIGYRARTAEDGFSALALIREESPDILLSDLNMPGMSGFELLSVVRRRFPAIAVIAMSGAFSGDEVPSGVAADAFYQKGSSVASLLKMMENLPRPERVPRGDTTAIAPFWIQQSGRENSAEAFVAISCPNCLRTIFHSLNEVTSQVLETACNHCHCRIHSFKAQPADQASLLSFEQRQDSPPASLYRAQALSY
jgi:CheY-like chemotaxis protein